MSTSFTEPEFIFLDVSAAAERVGGAEALQGLMVMLEESLTRDIPRISELLAAGDVRAANKLLHGLKGFIPIFCVEGLCEQVKAVEELSKQGGLDVVAPAWARLQPDLDLLLDEVIDYLNGPA